MIGCDAKAGSTAMGSCIKYRVVHKKRGGTIAGIYRLFRSYERAQAVERVSAGKEFILDKRKQLSPEVITARTQARVEAQAVRAYLKGVAVVAANRKPGRRKSPQQVIDETTLKLETEPDPLEKLKLTQKLFDAKKQLKCAEDSLDMAALESDFVKHGGSYGERHKIGYDAWREMEVPAGVLRTIGVTRR